MKHDVPTRDWSEAVEYLTRRGFDVTDNRFLYSTSKTHGRVNKRFILPFTYKGKVVGIQQDGQEKVFLMECLNIIINSLKKILYMD